MPLATIRRDSTQLDRVDARLKEIAGSLTERHHALDRTYKAMAADAAQNGKELLEAQKLHTASGQKGKGFKRWIEQNCPFSFVTAYKYIRMHEAVKKNPALLATGLSDAYKQARIVKSLPAPKRSRRPRTRRGSKSAAVRRRREMIRIPLAGGCGIRLRLRKGDAERYRRHGVKKLLTLVSAVTQNQPPMVTSKPAILSRSSPTAILPRVGEKRSPRGESAQNGRERNDIGPVSTGMVEAQDCARVAD